MNDRFRSHPSRREAAALVGAIALAVVATQLDWATVSASCANTDATRGFGGSAEADPWSWLYLMGVVAGLGSTLVAPRLALRLILAGAVVSGVSLVVLAMLVTEPFEAFRPASAGGPVGTLCGFDLAIGSWVGTLAVVLLVLAAALRVTGGRIARG